jgi:hypothetical protein
MKMSVLEIWRRDKLLPWSMLRPGERKPEEATWDCQSSEYQIAATAEK